MSAASHEAKLETQQQETSTMEDRKSPIKEHTAAALERIGSWDREALADAGVAPESAGTVAGILEQLAAGDSPAQARRIRAASALRMLGRSAAESPALSELVTALEELSESGDSNLSGATVPDRKHAGHDAPASGTDALPDSDPPGRQNSDLRAVRMVPVDELPTAPPFSTLCHADPVTVDRIAASIACDGFDRAHPVIQWGERGVVVDGHSRLNAAKKAGLNAVPVIEKSFPDEDSALDYAIACQVNRRNLSDADIMRLVKELHRRRPPANQHSAVRNVADSSGSDRRKRSSAAETAEKLGISQRKAEQARTIVAHAEPEVKAAVDSGEMSINRAYQQTQGARKARSAEQVPSPAKVRRENPLPAAPPPEQVATWEKALGSMARECPDTWRHALAECMRAEADSLDSSADDVPACEPRTELTLAI